MAAAKRTKSGAPSAAARKQTGGGKGMRAGSFPVFDAKSADDALKLRGHAPNPDVVIDKVSRYAAKTGNAGLKAKVKKARDSK
jgi:hypothetical protein